MHKNNDKHDELLASIQQVPSPDYLFTRIQAAIRQEQSAVLSLPSTLSFAVGLLLILALNIWALQLVMNSTPALEDVANSMHLINHVTLY